MAKSGYLAGTWRWLKRIGLGVVVLIAGTTAFGTAYEFHARGQAHEKYPPPGQMVDIGGRRMHLDCRGEGSPTVVLEAGLGSAGSLGWDPVHNDLARITRTCAYDRAGILWSEPKSSPQDADAVAQDLHATLTAAGVSGPLVLVGHSLGGSYIMSFTRQFPDDVQGLVFVDCSHPDQMERLPQEIADTMRVPFAYKILGALSWTGIFRVLPLPDAPGVPDHIKAIAVAYRSETVGSVLAEAEAMPTSLAQSGQLRDLGSRPTVVLTAQKPLPDQQLASLGLTPEEGEQYLALAKELHMDQASWSSRSRQQDIPDSGHLVQFDRPDIVIGAVNEVVQAVGGNW